MSPRSLLLRLTRLWISLLFTVGFLELDVELLNTNVTNRSGDGSVNNISSEIKGWCRDCGCLRCCCSCNPVALRTIRTPEYEPNIRSRPSKILIYMLY